MVYGLFFIFLFLLNWFDIAYNELWQEFKYEMTFKDDNLFEKVVKEIIQNFSTLDILVCGRP